MLLFELDGRSIAERRMFTLPVVEHFDGLEDRLSGLVPGLETVGMDQLRLEGMEETLGRGMVPAIALAAHAAEIPLVLQECLETAGGVRAAAVAMDQ